MEVINTIFIENLLTILAVILVLSVLIIIFLLPIIIANRKNIKGNELITIKVLTWCGLLSGITWIVALFLSIYYKRRI